tara:strand:+ start:277 stop:804 length:528 start_codon:yes stop_codon:yes gene_type:complete
VIKQDILEKQVEYTYLALGSNLGDKRRNIETAKSLLINNKIFIDDISSYYETSSWPDKNLPKFYNIILKVKTNLSLVNLFKIVKNIEKKIGRKKAPRNYPRMCDIDIIDFKGLYLKTKLGNDFIETPHPRMTSRDFVLFPLYEINKAWIHPKTKMNINSLINQLGNVDYSDIRIV